MDAASVAEAFQQTSARSKIELAKSSGEGPVGYELRGGFSIGQGGNGGGSDDDDEDFIGAYFFQQEDKGGESDHQQRTNARSIGTARPKEPTRPRPKTQTKPAALQKVAAQPVDARQKILRDAEAFAADLKHCASLLGQAATCTSVKPAVVKALAVRADKLLSSSAATAPQDDSWNHASRQLPIVVRVLCSYLAKEGSEDYEPFVYQHALDDLDNAVSTMTSPPVELAAPLRSEVVFRAIDMQFTEALLAPFRDESSVVADAYSYLDAWSRMLSLTPPGAVPSTSLEQFGLWKLSVETGRTLEKREELLQERYLRRAYSLQLHAVKTKEIKVAQVSAMTLARSRELQFLALVNDRVLGLPQLPADFSQARKILLNRILGLDALALAAMGADQP